VFQEALFLFGQGTAPGLRLAWPSARSTAQADGKQFGYNSGGRAIRIRCWPITPKWGDRQVWLIACSASQQVEAVSFKAPVALSLLLLCAGCSTQMLKEGWADHTSPVGASQMNGYSPPVATKVAAGNVRFEYDVQVVRYGMLGHWSGPYRIMGRERVTNIVDQAALRSATNFWQMMIDHAICPAAAQSYRTAGSGSLPVLESQIKGDVLTYPSTECVLWASDWVWYVPPRDDGAVPMAAVVSADRTTTRRHVYPLRIALFPVLLVGDILYWPVVFIASGGHPTM
jgi:hypothetical protein